MNGLWLWVGAMLIAVLGVLLFGLTRTRRTDAPSRGAFDIAVFKDQLAELDRDRGRGLISDSELTSARSEIEHRLLKAADEADTEVAQQTPKPARYAEFSLIVLILVGAIAFYLSLGSPNFPSAPYAARNIKAELIAAEQERAGSNTVALVDKLAMRMKMQPDDIRGWLLLGRSYLAMGRGDDAIAAIQQARSLAPEQGKIAVELAETMIVAADNRVPPEARELLENFVGADPYNPKPRYYIALSQAQSGETSKALQGWIDLTAISPANASWLPTVREKITNAARDLGVDPSTIKPSIAARMLARSIPVQPLLLAQPPKRAPVPSQADVNAAAELSNSDRLAMIRTMVQRLADRLRENPEDLQGWVRLEHAYRVLGNLKKADEAATRVRALGG